MTDDFVERLARQVTGCQEHCSFWTFREPVIRCILDAIARIGCKVTEREPTTDMSNSLIDNHTWREMHDAASPYPGGAPDPRDARIAELEEALRSAVDRLDDILMRDDGQAFSEAERALPSIRPTLAGKVAS